MDENKLAEETTVKLDSDQYSELYDLINAMSRYVFQSLNEERQTRGLLTSNFTAWDKRFDLVQEQHKQELEDAVAQRKADKEEQKLQLEEQRKINRAQLDAVLSKIESINDSKANQAQLAEMEKLNTNIEQLIEYQQNGLQGQVNTEFLGSTITVVLIVAVAGYATIKVFGWIGSKIANMIFT